MMIVRSLSKMVLPLIAAVLCATATGENVRVPIEPKSTTPLASSAST